MTVVPTHKVAAWVGDLDRAEGRSGSEGSSGSGRGGQAASTRSKHATYGGGWINGRGGCECCYYERSLLLGRAVTSSSSWRAPLVVDRGEGGLREWEKVTEKGGPMSGLQAKLGILGSVWRRRPQRRHQLPWLSPSKASRLEHGMSSHVRVPGEQGHTSGCKGRKALHALSSFLSPLRASRLAAAEPGSWYGIPCGRARSTRPVHAS